MHHLAVALLAFFLQDPAPLLAPKLETTAEASGYTRTSSHAEVIAFCNSLRARGAAIRLQEIGASSGGLPMLLCATGAAARLDARRIQRAELPVVYVQANIHGGEVDGKEGILALLRDLLLGEEAPLLDRVALLVVPNYNPDGNDRFGPASSARPGQVGPDPVGGRYNAGGLDLNRDYVKAASPELRAVLAEVLLPWDPDVFIDLHTTNGSHHGFTLTYAPSLQPTPGEGFVAPEHFVRERLLPRARRALQEQHGFASFDYGNFDRASAPSAWETYEHRPRFGTNYAALRGRMGILSESYSYADYRTRIAASRAFVLELLREIAAHGAEIRSLHREHDRRIARWGAEPSSAPPLGIEFEMAARPEAEVMLAGVMERGEDGRARPTGKLEPRSVVVKDRFRATRSVAYPAGFFLPPSELRLREALTRHGVIVQTVLEPWSGELERFEPRELRIQGRAFQERRLLRASGERRLAATEIPAGWVWISSAQPLGLLVSYFLDPEYEDGLIAWRECDFEAQQGTAFPVLRALAPPAGLVAR
ncbi:MAG: M14 family metallopeptidase [Planctomycetes bacterium]|nr:M14 family metallopeptidase [Planctomycetota bacterium]